MSFILEDPQPVSSDFTNRYLDVEKLLVQVRTQVESRYNQKILVFIITTSQRTAADKETLRRYALDLHFVNRNHFQYRLLELNCALDQPFSVEVIAPSESPQQMGTATSIQQLEPLIQAVFAAPSTRRTILINYNL